MDKLKNLFKQAGVSEQLSDAIIEEMSNHAKLVKEEYEQRFQNKLAKAQTVAQDLINKEKVRLAKKVAIYLESKKEYIDRAAEKQRLNEDTEATSLLKRTRALLEGINVEDPGQNRELQVARKHIERLRRVVGTLKEEREVAVHKANDANQIALKHLKINRLLESKMKAGSALVEKVKPKNDKSKVVKPKSNITEGKKTRRRLDSRRRVSAKGRSTRPILEQNQTSGKSSPLAVDSKIAGIAAKMDDD